LVHKVRWHVRQQRGRVYWFLNQYNDTHAIIEVEQGSHANDKVMAVAVRETPPPPPSPIKVFITQPKTGATVSALSGW